MKRPVLLTIVGTQYFSGEEPESVKLVTDGTMEETADAILLSYEESELTGLSGTHTVFRVEEGRVILTRTGTLESQMVFVPGEEDRSLYDMGGGALMICVRTEHIQSEFTEAGGRLKVSYAISIEEETAGRIEYSIDIRNKEAFYAL